MIINILSNLNQRNIDAILVERINFNQVNKQFDFILNEPLKNIEIYHIMQGIKHLLLIYSIFIIMIKENKRNNL